MHDACLFLQSISLQCFQFGNTIPLVQPIEFVLKHKSMEDFSDRKCVYWNFEEDGWSQKGCYAVKKEVCSLYNIHNVLTSHLLI